MTKARVLMLLLSFTARGKKIANFRWKGEFKSAELGMVVCAFNLRSLWADLCEFKTSQRYIIRLCLKRRKGLNF